MKSLIKGAVASMRQKARSQKLEVEIDSPSDVLQWQYWAGDKRLRFYICTSMLRLQGAFNFGGDNPLVAGLSSGAAAMSEFYRSFQPETITQMYDLRVHGRAGEDLSPWELPWVGYEQRTAPPGECGLGPEHGVSYFGPATEKKVSLEVDRLTEVSRSIQTKGYRPERFGDIEGYFMSSERSMCFFVRGGKHRAAALAFSGVRKIPVAWRDNWPRVIHRHDSPNWPLVRSGRIDKDLALEIFDRYLVGR